MKPLLYLEPCGDGDAAPHKAEKGWWKTCCECRACGRPRKADVRGEGDEEEQ